MDRRNVKVYINNIQVFVPSGSLRIEKKTEEHWNVSFRVHDFDGRFHFYEGDRIEIYDDDDLKFSGFVEQSKEEGVITKNGMLRHNIRGIGNEFLVENVVIVKAYVDEYIHNIVMDIFDSYLTQQGLEIGRIDSDNEEIKQAGFSYVNCAKALNNLAKRGGYVWYVDQHKRFFFVKRANNDAPFPLYWENTVRNSVKVQHKNRKYRNVQYMKNVKGITNERFEIKLGDGEERSFTVGYPISEEPKIETSEDGTNWTVKNVGVKGLDDGTSDYYWTHNSDTITSEFENDPLPDGHYLRITYKGLFNMVVRTNDPQEILKKEQKGIGTGRIENVSKNKFIGRKAGLQAADEKLREYSRGGTKITYQTFMDGLEPGMTQDSYLEEHEVEGKILLTSISISENDGVFTYSVEGIQGPIEEDWARYIKGDRDEDIDLLLGEQGREEFVVQPVLEFQKTWEETERPNMFPFQIYPSNNLLPSNSVYPSLNPEDTVKYIEVHVDGEPVERVNITQVNRTEEEVYSISFIPRNIVGNITGFSWIGGFLSTQELGTGIEMDFQEIEYEKNDLEILQIEKIDTRGWE